MSDVILGGKAGFWNCGKADWRQRDKNMEN
jgi:hypothetical protein